MSHSNVYWILAIVSIHLSNHSTFGFSPLRTNPSLSSSSSQSGISPSANNLQSLLESDTVVGIPGNDDISTLQQQISADGNVKLAHQQLQQLMEHSMISPLSSTLFGKKSPPLSSSSSSASLQQLNHADFLPQTSILSEDSDRPVYDPGDELTKNYNSDEHDDYFDAGTVPVGGNSDTDDKIGVLRRLEEEIRDEQDIISKSSLMMQMLEDPSIDTLPIVYVEEPIVTSPSQQIDSSFDMLQGANVGLEKRSRYYRRYPWKRHSSKNRGTYEADARYLCVPSKEDVFKLLVGLHENRNGNHHKTVNFCNRKRPAKTIFTNIRFLG